MNPSSAPVSQAQWAAIVPDQLANAPTHDFRASPVREKEGLEGPCVCQQCGKQYTRTCDLNKHFKTHIRPFKCPVDSCKYHMFGWPTEKELDRHYNDKHSAEPSEFSCLWRECTYTSRRESNCKQHMEKTHGWNYIRSRPGNKEESPLKQLGDDPDHTHLVGYPNSNLNIRAVPGLSFSPSPLKPCFSAPHDSPTAGNSNGAVPYGADVYIPWSSPVSGSRENESFMEGFSQTYAADAQVATCDDEWLKVPVDPRLYDTTALENPTFERPSTPQVASNRGQLLKVLPTIVTSKESPDVKTQVLTPLSEPSPVFVQHSCSVGEGGPPQDVETGPGRKAATSWGLRSGNNGRLAPFGKRQARFSREPDGDSEEDEEHPRKRAKALGGHDDELGDRRMPCPFRVANPEIYDLNHDQKYYSCHTEHANISTVVRHLGRPAHNLDVDNARQSISSFNVADNEHGHPRAGLCKKCWRAFSDSEAFEAHINAKCENVSRSKREKFDILLNTFCRIEGGRQRHSADDDSDAEGSGEYSEGEAEDVPARNTNRVPVDDLVSRGEFLALAARLTALESAFTQRVSQATPRIMPAAQADALVSSALGTGIQPAQPFSHYSFDTGPGPSTTRPAGTRGMARGMGPDPGPIHYGNPAGFGQDAERIMSGFRAPVAARRPDGGASTAHCPNPHAGGDQGGRPSETPPTGSTAYRGTAATARMTNVAAAAAAAAASGGGGGVVTGGGPGGAGVSSGSGSNPEITRAQAAEYGQEGISQESADTMMPNRWYQGVDPSDAVLERVNFFDPPMDEINRFLNMDPQ